MIVLRFDGLTSRNRSRGNGQGRYVGIDARYSEKVLTREHHLESLGRMMREHSCPTKISGSDYQNVISLLRPHVSRCMSCSVILKGGQTITIDERTRSDPGLIHLPLVNVMKDTKNPEPKLDLALRKDRLERANMIWQITTPREEGDVFPTHYFLFHAYATAQVVLHEIDEVVRLFGRQLRKRNYNVFRLKENVNGRSKNKPAYKSGYVSITKYWLEPRLEEYRKANKWAWKLFCFDGDHDVLQSHSSYNGFRERTVPDYTKPAPSLPEYLKVSS